MSFLTGTQMECLYAGPIAYQAAGNATTGWVAPAASVTTAQPLFIGATGASGAAGWTQPMIPAGYFQQGRSGQLVKIIVNGIISWVSTASTTATFTWGWMAAANGSTTTAPTLTTTLITSMAFINNSAAQTNVPWRCEMDILSRQVGYGTTVVSTALLTTGIMHVSAATAANQQYNIMTPTVTTNTDFSVNNWFIGTITFGTNASASNTATALNCFVFGCN